MKRIVFIFSLLSMVCSAQEFVVMTYNIRCDTPQDGVNSWSEGNRKERALTLITEQQPAILGVQEALYNQVEDLETKLVEYQRIGVGRDDGNKKGEHMALFFRKDMFKLLDSGNFWLSQTPEIPSKGWDATCCNRICTWVKLQYAGREFFVFNTHFDHEGQQAQQQSAKLILQKIKEIAKKKPVILMGDFNMTPDNLSVQMIAKKLYDTRYVASEEIKNKGTFNAFRPNEPLKGHIDYIFTTPDIKTIHYQIIDKLIDNLYPSDHLPVVVTLKL